MSVRKHAALIAHILWKLGLTGYVGLASVFEIENLARGQGGFGFPAMFSCLLIFGLLYAWPTFASMPPLVIGRWLVECFLFSAVVALMIVSSVSLGTHLHPAVAFALIVAGALCWGPLVRRSMRADGATMVTAQEMIKQLKVARESADVAEKRRAIAESRAAELTAQLAPHFISNTLGQLKYFIKKDNDAARELLDNLIDYLRERRTDGKLSSLGAEFATVNAYLKIQKVRFHDRLTVFVDDLPEDLSDVPIAPFVIPTLVENAIQHGIEPKGGAVSVHVLATRSDDGQMICIDVVDDGVGLKANPSTRGTGLGLKNVSDQIRLRHGSTARLSLSGGLEGGAISRLEIPFPALG